MQICKYRAINFKGVGQAFVMPQINFSSNPHHALFDVHSLFEDTIGIMDDWRNSIKVQTDGWILGPQARLLLCVPHIYLAGLFGPRTKCVIGTIPTMLDLSHFSHGKSWQNCYQGKQTCHRNNSFGGYSTHWIYLLFTLSIFFLQIISPK